MNDRIPLQHARVIVERLAGMIADTCERLEIAGSIRRGRADVKDAEIVAISRGSDLLARLDQMVQDGTIRKALYGEKEQTRWGSSYRGLVFDGLRVEIFTADEHSWGNQFWLRTGPGDANQFVMKWLIWKRAPLRFQGGSVWWSANWMQVPGGWDAADKRRLSLREESDLFAVLGLPEIEPAMRSDVMYEGLLDVQKLPVDFSKWYVPELQQGALTLDAEWQPRAVDPDVKAADRAYNEQLLAKHRQIFERAATGQPLADWERRIVENRRAIERAKALMERGQQ